MGDSQLVIKQLTGEYQCFNGNIMEYYSSARELLTKFLDFEQVHILRYQNAEANELTQMAFGYCIPKELAYTLINASRKS